MQHVKSIQQASINSVKTLYLKGIEDFLSFLNSLVLVQRVAVGLVDIALQPVGINVCRLQALCSCLLSSFNVCPGAHLTRSQLCLCVVVYIIIVWILKGRPTELK